jgi:NADH-quinone oxidoreductase subunit L
MTGGLVLLAVLSALGGFIALPHFLEPLLPLPAVHESLESYETPLLVLSVVLALAGLAGAAFLYGGSSARVDAIATRFATPHRWLMHKYYIDELYQRVLGTPLVWISERVFLRFSDRIVLDGTLNGLGALGRFGGGLLGRVQAGRLNLYVWFVLVGIVGALLWSWHHV